MLKETDIAQAQLQIIQAQFAVKEYAANWLKEAKTVTRDASGKFASRAVGVTLNEVFKEGREHISLEKEHLGQLTDRLAEYIHDPELAKREISTELIKMAGKGLEKLVEKNPEMADALLNQMFGLDAQRARDKLADLYGEINPGLQNAIKPDPFKEIVNDIKGLEEGRDPKELAKDLGRAFERTVYKYEKLIYDLNNLETDSEAINKLGEVAAASLPVATYLGFALTPELMIGLLFRESLPMILGTFVAGEVASKGINEVMDELDVENFPLRLAVDILGSTAASMTAAGGLKALKKSGMLKNLKSIDFEKIAQQKAQELQKIIKKA